VIDHGIPAVDAGTILVEMSQGVQADGGLHDRAVAQGADAPSTI